MLLNPRPQLGGIQAPQGTGGFYPGMAARPISRPMGYPRARPVLGSMKNGGKINKTGLYKLHAGEKVVSLKQLMKGCHV